MASTTVHTSPCRLLAICGPRLVLAFSLVFSLAAAACGQPVLQRIHSLGLQTLRDSEIVAWHSADCEGAASRTAVLLGGSCDFFEDEFGVSRSFSLAVLDEADWTKTTSIPYGLPFVSGPPFVICMPANSDNPLSASILTALQGSYATTKLGSSPERAVERYVSLIGFHEVGHIYARSFGIPFPNKWIFEFAATYFAYCYLAECAPDEARLWVDVSEVLLRKFQPAHTTLDDFEALYVKVGVENYAWYQVAFLLRVREVYESHGSGFLRELRDFAWDSQASRWHLGDIDRVAAGFSEWAAEMKLAPAVGE